MAVIGTDDDYGRGGTTDFINVAEESGICIASHHIVPKTSSSTDP